jgi:hypothetical protein
MQIVAVLIDHEPAQLGQAGGLGGAIQGRRQVVRGQVQVTDEHQHACFGIGLHRFDDAPSDARIALAYAADTGVDGQHPRSVPPRRLEQRPVVPPPEVPVVPVADGRQEGLVIEVAAHVGIELRLVLFEHHLEPEAHAAPIQGGAFQQAAGDLLRLPERVIVADQHQVGRQKLFVQLSETGGAVAAAQIAQVVAIVALERRRIVADGGAQLRLQVSLKTALHGDQRLLNGRRAGFGHRGAALCHPSPPLHRRGSACGLVGIDCADRAGSGPRLPRPELCGLESSRARRGCRPPRSP